MSNGVKAITQFLISHTILFKSEYRIKECRDKLPLPFDFAIFKDGKLIGLIEYQGVQHFQSVRRFGGRKALNKQQQHDLIKVNFCLANKIPFLIISFEEEKDIVRLCEEFFRIVF